MLNSSRNTGSNKGMYIRSYLFIVLSNCLYIADLCDLIGQLERALIGRPLDFATFYFEFQQMDQNFFSMPMEVSHLHEVM